MKKDDHGQYEYFGDRTEECLKDRHVSCRNEQLNNVQRHDPAEYLYSDGAPHKLVELIQHVCDESDLNEINQPNWYDPRDQGQSLRAEKV